MGQITEEEREARRRRKIMRTKHNTGCTDEQRARSLDHALDQMPEFQPPSTQRAVVRPANTAPAVRIEDRPSSLVKVTPPAEVVRQLNGPPRKRRFIRAKCAGNDAGPRSLAQYGLDGSKKRPRPRASTDPDEAETGGSRSTPWQDLLEGDHEDSEKRLRTCKNVEFATSSATHADRPPDPGEPVASNAQGSPATEEDPELEALTRELEAELEKQLESDIESASDVDTASDAV
ncbi:hypothetical protein JX266_009691 [Neoarthrinium moseri]|uniref:uncharacterized protein n=1 Tax=Neoarthrinium moseri TaxID=1658444 RepID=UPI001FDE2BF9|nr:uncharacterized protein JN550_006089 [Neoarthrinium moseri]KAI1844207.1 hypothetical protein JX266_009691 [Neoarthrinium moseri]KAI1869102.1 hypothetical protein JN550_006089 [Neoarthrinium moseri]